MKFLDSGDSSLESFATIALGRIGNRDAAPSVAKLLTREDEYLCGHAAEALGRMGAREYLPHILKLLRDDRAYVRRMATDAVGNLGAKEAIPELRRLLRDADGEIKTSATRALVALGVREAIPEIRKLLKNKDTYVFSAAVDAIVILDARDSIPQLLEALRTHPFKEDGIIAALVEMRAHSAVPTLTEYMRQNDKDLVVGSLAVLGRLGDAKAVPAILPLLDSVDWDVRTAAAQALCALGSKEGVPTLLYESQDLTPLNALRNPKVWRSLSQGVWEGERRWEEGRFLSNRRLLGRLGVQAKMAVRLPQEIIGEDRKWLAKREPHEFAWHQLPLLEVLRAVVRHRYSAILEDDAIRVVPQQEASRIWNAWWVEEQKKQPKK